MSNNYASFKINEEELLDLRYADDTALFADTTSGMQHLLSSVKRHSEEKGLILNIKKTKFMDLEGSINKPDIIINNEEVENVKSFEYLGSPIDNKGDCSKEIKRRLALEKLAEMEKLWKIVNIKAKIRVLRTIVFPIGTDGCESWTLSKPTTDRKKAFENK